MKSFALFSTFILLIVTSCRESKPVEYSKTALPKVRIKEILVTSNGCLPEKENCSYAQITYPEYTDSSATFLNKLIADKILLIGSDYFREGMPEHIQPMAETFVKDFENFKTDYPDYNFGWYLQINAELILDGKDLVSLRISSDAYTGGAHPNSNVRYIVISSSSGQEMSLTDLVADTVAFKEATRLAFRRQKGLEDGQPISDLGYFISDEDFILTDNIGLTDQDVIVHFNPYEIAPYSDGPTTILLSRASLGKILK